MKKRLLLNFIGRKPATIGVKMCCNCIDIPDCIVTGIGFKHIIYMDKLVGTKIYFALSFFSMLYM